MHALNVLHKLNHLHGVHLILLHGISTMEHEMYVWFYLKLSTQPTASCVTFLKQHLFILIDQVRYFICMLHLCLIVIIYVSNLAFSHLKRQSPKAHWLCFNIHQEHQTWGAVYIFITHAKSSCESPHSNTVLLRCTARWNLPTHMNTFDIFHGGHILYGDFVILSFSLLLDTVHKITVW